MTFYIMRQVRIDSLPTKTHTILTRFSDNIALNALRCSLQSTEKRKKGRKTERIQGKMLQNLHMVIKQSSIL